MPEVPAAGEGAQPGEPPARGRDRRSPAASADEHYGPLRVVRTVKDDGRALILYSRDEQPPT